MLTSLKYSTRDGKEQSKQQQLSTTLSATVVYLPRSQWPNITSVHTWANRLTPTAIWNAEDNDLPDG
jgi:hypothetical protein